jgi:hypothetical protein
VRLVLHHEGDALAEAGPGARGDGLDLAAAPQVDPCLAGVGDVGADGTELDHGHEGQPHVVGLILAYRGHLHQRRRPRAADRLAVSVPAVEHDRPLRLGADVGGGEGTLAPLLRLDQLATPEVDEGGAGLVRVRPGVRDEAVEPQQVPQHLVGEQVRLATVVAVGDGARRLDELGHLIAQRRELARLLRAPPRHQATESKASTS